MSRYLGSTALEYAVFQYILRSVPDLHLFKHPRGWPAIELPNPDGTWEAHHVYSKNCYSWIQNTYARFTRGLFVLTEAEVKRVAMLLAGDALVNAPHPLVLPLEPTTKYEPVLEAVVNFMLHALRVEKKTRYVGSVTDLRKELIKAADRLGLPARSIPSSSSWLSRIIGLLTKELHCCGIQASFYRTEVARCVVLEWTKAPPPTIDGRDSNLTPPKPNDVSSKVQNGQGLSPDDGTDGKASELDWDQLKPKEESSDG